ncbi:MAG: trypsin-like peptidase domain-containing protein [Actinobacteria bacterium]|nr:trypsin-like peptidase domain-containing protein [Actinomycetota bacterium]MBA3565455.1 trypsin-like peptidase domain-containing protein [Actinomycetota bacterium]MDQ3085367.1 trypsin-like peptidase domain-containing protein [Actinomycetota bacterium]
MALSPVRPYIALVATAAFGAAVAVGAVALLGGFEGSTTTTVVTETAAPRAAAAPSTGGMSVNEIYERAAPGVVQIASTNKTADAFSGDLPSSALGSGFVVDKAGHIVTNFHVVEDADEIRVSFSNRDTVEAELVGTDPSTDLAVLRVESQASALTPLPLGDSDLVRVGDPVVAIGNPFGLDRTATAGIVSALQRLITAPNQFTIDHVIQTDAPINRGNSGGPLLNAQGEVIGVNTQIETGGISTGNVGIGFSVPSNTVEDVVAQILQTGRAEHAYLGISGHAVTPDLAETYNLPVESGVLVEEVRPASGAAKAGLEAGETRVVVAGETYDLGGDIIVAADGEQVSSIEKLRDTIAARKPGDKIKLRIYRDAKRTSVTVTLGRQPSSAR